MMFRLLFTLMLTFTCAHASELSDEEIIARIMSVAKPLPEDRVFYRWQKVESSDTLLKAGQMDETLYKYFKQPRNEAAGPGLYMSGNIHSSSQYVRKASGTLIEVHVKKGTPYIDYAEPGLEAKLLGLGISDYAINESVHAPVLVRYDVDPDWWVFKGREGVSFSKFDSTKVSVAELSKAYFAMDAEKPHARNVLLSLIKDDLLSRLNADPSLLKYKIYNAVLPEPEIIHSLESLLKQSKAPGDDKLELVLDYFRQNPRLQMGLSAEAKRDFRSLVSATDNPIFVSRGLSVLAKIDNATDFNAAFFDLLERQNVSEQVREAAIAEVGLSARSFLSEANIARRRKLASELAKELDPSSEMVEAYIRLVVNDPERLSTYQGTIEKWLSKPTPFETRVKVFKQLKYLEELHTEKFLTRNALVGLQELVHSAPAVRVNKLFEDISRWSATEDVPLAFLESTDAEVRAKVVNWLLSLDESRLTRILKNAPPDVVAVLEDGLRKAVSYHRKALFTKVLAAAKQVHPGSVRCAQGFFESILERVVLSARSGGGR